MNDDEEYSPASDPDNAPGGTPTPAPTPPAPTHPPTSPAPGSPPAPEAPRYDMMGDETLVTMSERGDKGAYEALLHRHLDLMFTGLLAALGSSQEATAALAACLGRISTSLGDFKGETSYATWQEHIVREEMSLRLRSRYRAPAMVSIPWYEVLALDHSLPLHAAAKGWLETSLGELPDKPPLAKAIELTLTRRERPEQVATHCKVSMSQYPVLIYEALHQLAHSRKAVEQVSRAGSSRGADAGPDATTQPTAPESPSADSSSPLEGDELAPEGSDAAPDTTSESADEMTDEERAQEEQYERTERILLALPALDEIPEERLKKRIANISDFVTALVAEDATSEIGRVIDEEDVPLARCAQAAWFAGCDDFLGRLSPEIASRLVDQSWTVLVGTREAARGPQGISGWLSSHPILATIAASALVLAASFIYYNASANAPAPPPKLPKAKAVAQADSGLGRIPSPPGLAGQTVSYRWTGSQLPQGVPAVAEVRLIAEAKGPKALTSDGALAIANRFDMGEERLEAPELSDSYIFGKGTAESPTPGSYRLDIRSTDGHWSLAWIGTGQEEPLAEAPSPMNPSTAIGSAREYLTDKGVPESALTRATMEDLGDGKVAVRFRVKVDGIPIVDETGVGEADEAIVVYDADRTIIEAEGWSPATIKNSTYPLLPAQSAIASLGSNGQSPATTATSPGAIPAEPAITIDMDEMRLAYQYLQSETGSTYLVPVYVLTGEEGAASLVVEAVKQPVK